MSIYETMCGAGVATIFCEQVCRLLYSILCAHNIHHTLHVQSVSVHTVMEVCIPVVKAKTWDTSETVTGVTPSPFHF